MVYNGIIRMKVVDLANWAAREGIFNEAVAGEEDVRFATEGMDTVIAHVAKTDSLENLITEFGQAIDVSILKFGAMSDQMNRILKCVKAVLAAGSEVCTETFKFQFDDPGFSPYVEVVIRKQED